LELFSNSTPHPIITMHTYSVTRSTLLALASACRHFGIPHTYKAIRAFLASR